MDTSKRQRTGLSASSTFSAGILNAIGGRSFSRIPETGSMAGHTPPRPPPNWRAPEPSPQSPAKRASQSVLGSRKILERPQGPSSRLASSSTRQPAPLPAATPRKVFKSSIANGESRFAFSPRVPYNTMKESFPAATPARSSRAPAAEVHGRGMARTTETHLFNMRIHSPPPELDGEALARQVPEDRNRVGSTYADEFLGHLVPPDLDEHQRRQFLCILDLRRLKYAATEIFAKKGWKINMMNFAKEYEKSRSLIMLRYGLYEFKTVPVTGELMKKWKAENNVPSDEEEEPEEAPVPRANGTQGILARPNNKRRADDDLTKDSAVTTSSSTQNKRRAMEPLAETSKAPSLNMGTPAPSQNKRRATVADEEVENRQSQRAGATTPSATKSLFEKIANNTPSSTTTPAKPSRSVFESSAAKPASNPFATSASTNNLARSVLDKGPKAAAAPSFGGIFGHLSDAGSAKGSGNEADADEESEDESEVEEESEVQEVSQSDEPSVAASGGVATPSQYGAGASLFSKPAPGLSSTPSETGDIPANGPSLFDRITKDSKGNPVRAEQPEAPSLFSTKRAASPLKDSFVPPADNTWNPNTPIKFGEAVKTPASSSLFASKTDASSTPSVDFGAPATKPTETPRSTEAQDFTPGGSKPTSSLFGLTQASPAGTGASLFSSASKPTDTGSKLFGSSSMFSQQKKDDVKPTEPAPSASTPSLFGLKPAAAPAANSALQSSTLFGAAKAPESTATQPASNTLFGGAKTSSNMFGAMTGTPASVGSTPSLFGGATSQAAPSLFGVQTPAQAEEKKAPAVPELPKPSEGVEDTNAGEVFGAKSSGPAKTFAFGGGASASAAKLPPKTEAAAKGSTEAADVFGGASAAGEKKYTFGAAPAAPAATPAVETKSLFGNPSTSQTEAPKPPSSLFGPSTTPSTSFTFGTQTNGENSPFGASGSKAVQAAPSAPSAPSLFANNASSFSFNAGSGQSGFNNPFASGNDSSAAPSFNFGASSGGAAQGTSSFAFGSSTAAQSTPSAGFSFGASSQPATSAPAQPSGFGGATNGGSSMFNFGGASQSSAPSMFSQQQQQPANAAQSIFGHLNVPQGGTSTTGSNTPFFGGASSLATTPATGTPEPEANKNDEEQEADEDGKPQDQLNLSEGGPGEEDEEILHDVRAKALKFVPDKPGSDSESQDTKKDNKSPWKTQGVGPLRLLKHKTTGAVRMLLRAEPRGHVALNRAVLPNFEYKVEKGGKYVKVMTGNDAGNGLETWMLQVKTNDAAKALAEALEANKNANKK